MTWPIRSILKSKYNYYDLFNRVRSVIKTRKYNDMFDCTGAVYDENETELSWPIKSGDDCDENQIGQLR